MKRKVGISLLILSAVLVIAGLVWPAPLNRVHMLLEERAITQAAERYFQAEMSGDTRLIYSLLAPSSIYRKTHSYEDYLKDLHIYPPVKIVTYRIVGVTRLRQNDDRNLYPNVDKLAQVEVDVTFAHSGSNMVFNYSFTFLKEKGAWCKG